MCTSSSSSEGGKRMRSWWRRRAVSVLLALLAGSAAALELPGDVARQGDLQASPPGEARWLGLRLYEAVLWSPRDGWRGDDRFALALRYSRDFSAQRLTDASLEEMTRLFAPSAEQLTRWRVLLSNAFPDVNSGDVLVGVFEPHRGVVFYHRGVEHSRIDDVEFAERFFAIWLDARTRLPALRERLLDRPAGG